MPHNRFFSHRKHVHIVFFTSVCVGHGYNWTHENPCLVFISNFKISDMWWTHKHVQNTNLSNWQYHWRVAFDDNVSQNGDVGQRQRQMWQWREGDQTKRLWREESRIGGSCEGGTLFRVFSFKWAVGSFNKI